MSGNAGGRPFGVEEEFMLLNPDSLVPVDAAERVRAELSRHEALRPFLSREFFACQIEHSSPVLCSAAEAAESLAGFRRSLAGAAAAVAVVAGGVGTPFQTDGLPTITQGERYERVRDEFRGVADEHFINGLHVHVSVADPDEAVRALNGVRPWLPVLMALSANSPFHAGRDAGFVSWRAIHARRWSTAGVPPSFVDGADYIRRTRALIGVAGTIDAGTISWMVRIPTTHPTLELRVCDSQLDADSALMLALLVRSLVETSLTCGAVAQDLSSELLDAALWHAARSGLDGTLVDPFTGQLCAADFVVGEFLTWVRSALDDTGDYSFVVSRIRRCLRDGSGARRQRAAYAVNGIAGLRTLIESETARSPQLAEPPDEGRYQPALAAS